MLLDCNNSNATNHYNNQLSQPGQSCCSLDSSMMVAHQHIFKWE